MTHTPLTLTEIRGLPHDERAELLKRISAIIKQEAEGTYLTWT